MHFTYDGLWKILEEKKISLAEVAERAGIDAPELEKMKSGEPASKALLENLCKYLECKPEDLLDKSAIRVSAEIGELSDVDLFRFTLECRRRLHIAKRYEDLKYDLAAVQEDKKSFVLTGYFLADDIREIDTIIREVFEDVKSKEEATALKIEIENCPIPPEPAKPEPRKPEPRKPEPRRRFPEPTPEPNSEPNSEETRSEERKGSREDVASEKKKRLDYVKKAIDSLVGAKEFRELCREIISVAPQFTSRESKKVFLSQTYLFSISEGEGLSTCLELLGKVVNDAGIAPISDRGPRESVIEYPQKMDDISNVLNQMLSRAFPGFSQRDMESGQVAVTCLDISEWIDHIGSALFKEFLRKISILPSNYIIVFRIPYVDKEVVNKVREALNDALYVRTIAFPPLSEENYRSLAKAELERYGFRMDAAAWPLIAKRLTAEKGDGTFYGIKTLMKVLNELLYKKAVSNATKSKPSRKITRTDAAGLVANHVEDLMSAQELLSSLVGMENVKRQLKEIVTQIEFARLTKDMSTPTMHMRFVGNPGTGKTTVARILGKILKEKGILRIGNFYEYSGRDFCGKFVGETSPRTKMMCRDAFGSILFIDEAYSLYRSDNDPQDYGREALDTLISEMENHRDDFLVIMAGYSDEMDTLMKGNVGLSSRMPYIIRFDNFSREELYSIFESLVKKNFKYDEEVLTEAKSYFMGLDDSVLSSKLFSNGRFVRNIFERTWAKAAMRRDLEDGMLKLIKEDFILSVSDEAFKKELGETRKTKRIGFATN